MKKGLITGAVLVVFAVMFMGVAGASEVSTGGRIEFKVFGTSQDGKPDFLLNKGAVRIDYEVSLTSGAFETVLMPRLDLPSTLKWEKAYIKYSFSPMNLQMHPLGLYDEFDLWDISGNAGDPNLPGEPGADVTPGIKLEIPVEPFTFALGAASSAVGDETQWNYALGAQYVINSVTLEGLYGGSDVEAFTWYGGYYGGRVALDLAPLKIEGQYGGFNPEAAGLEDGTGYFGKVEYNMEEVGVLTFKYTGLDKKLNGAGTATAKDYSKIYGEYKYPLADSVNLFVDVAQIEPGTGVDSYTEYELKMRVDF